MTRRRAPSRVARAGVALATAALRPADRERYRAEFLADLHELPPAAQLRHTAGFLVQSLALRAALGATPTRAEEAAMTLTTTRFSWRCAVLCRHRWVGRSAEDGARYQACARCGRDRTDYPSEGRGSQMSGAGIPLGY